MDQQDKKNLLLFFIVIVSAISSTIVIDFLYRIGAISYNDDSDKLIVALTNYIQYIRPHLSTLTLILITSLGAMSIFQTSTFKTTSTNYKITVIALSLTSALILMLGYNNYLYYNIIVYPLAFLTALIAIPKSISFIKTNELGEEKPVGISKLKDKEWSFSLNTTNDGKLYIFNPRQGIYIEGGAGAGKSASVIIPLIVQAIEKGFAGLVYDFEGDLTEGGGLLTKVVYTAIKQQKQKKIKFGFINFTDLSRTMRCNPFNAKYVQSSDHALEIATIIMYNLEKDWTTKRDFWANNAIATYAAAVWFFRRNHPEYCTMPHITEFVLNDFYLVLNILESDDETAKMIAPVIGALKREAAGQIAGAESSTQLPLTKLRSPNLYWVLNPDKEKEFSLDITNKEQPVMLAIGNSPELRNAYAPAIGAVMQICKMQMNKLGKNKSIFMVDELPTIYINKLDQLPAEARKKGVCTILAAQSYAQLIRDYGDKDAEVITDNMGNWLVGMSSTRTGEKVSKMMGKYQKAQQSHTAAESGNSQTQNTKDEEVTKISDITNQKIGHFTGKIAGGKPPMFQAQLEYFDYKTIELPAFSKPITIDDDPEEEMKILDEMVQNNYEQVKADINNLIHQKYSDHLQS